MNFRVNGSAIPKPRAELKEMYAGGNFDYLPDLLPDASLSDLAPVIRDRPPAHEMLPELPEETVEDLAYQNLDMLTSSRTSPRHRNLGLFVPVQMRPSSEVLEDEDVDPIAISEAAIGVEEIIPGLISGPNRQMLQIIYDELGIKRGKVPKVTEIETETLRGLQIVDRSRETHTGRRVSFTRRQSVSILMSRPVFDEIQGVSSSSGTTKSAVRFVPFKMQRPYTIT